MRKFFVLFVSLSLCAGCQLNEANGSTGDTDSTNGSGTRLKRRVLTSGDGAAQFIGWFDTERGENCSFRKVEWNVDRCIPDENVIDAATTTPQVVFFADATCSNKMAYVGAPSIHDCSQGLGNRYVIERSQESCKEMEFEIHKVGKRFAEDDSTIEVFGLDYGVCVKVGDHSGNEYAELTKVRVEEFAEGGERIE